VEDRGKGEEGTRRLTEHTEEDVKGKYYQSTLHKVNEIFLKRYADYRSQTHTHTQTKKSVGCEEEKGSSSCYVMDQGQKQEKEEEEEDIHFPQHSARLHARKEPLFY
tara:strand:+ start:444 stop:764 length:321 start_codon:yes stop_codon:yes gene_type:complete